MVTKEFKKLIAKNLCINIKAIKLNSSFVKDLGMDSLEFLELLMDVETIFKLKIPDNKAYQFRTVKDAVNYIKKHT
jgi:acyl carrier protein